MIIEADKQGMEIIRQLCDTALRVGGLQNLPTINSVLTSMKEKKDGED